MDRHSSALKRERWREIIYEKARKEVNSFGSVHVDEKKIKKAVDRAAYKVNIKHVDTKRYRKKVRSAVGKDAEDGTYKAIRRILVHRNGTAKEDSYAIDLSNGKTISCILNSEEEQRVSWTDNFKDAIMRSKKEGKEIAIIHNHPESSAPSSADIVSLCRSGAKVGVIACHDGVICTYKQVKEPLPGYNIDQESIDYVMMLRGNRIGNELFDRLEERFGVRIERFA